MKVIITGAAGQLGRALLRSLPEEAEVTAVNRTGPPEAPDLRRRAEWLRLDLTDAETTYREVSRRNPEIVFHCAAMTDVDACEKNPEEAYRQNALATRNVAAACQRFDALLVHYSTNFVLDGKEKTPYAEDAPIRPVNRYGWSKARAEEFVRNLLSRYFILRTSWLFGEGSPNIISRMVEQCRRGEIFCAQERACPTYAKDLAEASLRLAATTRYGIYHLTNSEPVSRAELARAVEAEAIRRGWISRPVRIRPLPRAISRRMAPRPRNGVLDNFQWRLEGFSPLRSWREPLREFLDRIGGEKSVSGER